MLSKLSCRCSLWFKLFFLTVTLGMESLLLTLSIPPPPSFLNPLVLFGSLPPILLNALLWILTFTPLPIFYSHFLSKSAWQPFLFLLYFFVNHVASEPAVWIFFYGSIFRLFKLKFYLTHKLFYFRLTLTIQALSFGAKLYYLPP